MFCGKEKYLVNCIFVIIIMKYELQHLIQGKGGDSKTSFIQKIIAHIRASKKASSATEGTEFTREQEEESLSSYIQKEHLWYSGIISPQIKIGEGAEQKVYYNEEKGVVIKTNDAIFFATWEDYLCNLIIHNYFFPDTAYTLLGFRNENNILYAVVEQPHIQSTENADLEIVRKFLQENGFVQTRKNDYYNSELGIILEDLHDENVIFNNQIPFFIDTVFYLTDKFFI